MRSNYKPIGNFIRQVAKRNTDLEVTKLLGLSMSKEFRETTSNIVGTDMSVYKVMEKWQFACDFMSPIRVNKLPVVLKMDDEPNLVSPAYPVFEIIDKNELDPEYLMMWFRRPEFDRYAAFKCDSAIRGGYDWDELCNTQLPVPHIDKQREIVKEYNTIVDRINLNNQLIQKLEETAQAIYKQWFVDFEFPDEEGKLYKSNGGEMEWNEELEMEVPKGWVPRPLSYFSDIKFSKRIFESEYTKQGIPFYRSREIILKKEGRRITNELYISSERYNEITNKFGSISKGDLLLTAVGTIGVSYIIANEKFYFKDGNLFWFKNFKRSCYSIFIYEWMQNQSFSDLLESITFGSTQKVITTTALYKLNVLHPLDSVLEHFEKIIRPIRGKMQVQTLLSCKLDELREVLLSKLSTIEN